MCQSQEIIIIEENCCCFQWIGSLYIIYMLQVRKMKNIKTQNATSQDEQKTTTCY